MWMKKSGMEDSGKTFSITKGHRNNKQLCSRTIFMQQQHSLKSWDTTNVHRR